MIHQKWSSCQVIQRLMAVAAEEAVEEVSEGFDTAPGHACIWALLHSKGAVGPSWIALWSWGVLNLFSICSTNFLRSISFVLFLLVQYNTIQLYAMYMKSTTTTISANTSSMPQIEVEHSHLLLEFSVPTFTRPMLVWLLCIWCMFASVIPAS